MCKGFSFVIAMFVVVSIREKVILNVASAAVGDVRLFREKKRHVKHGVPCKIGYKVV